MLSNKTHKDTNVKGKHGLLYKFFLRVLYGIDGYKRVLGEDGISKRSRFGAFLSWIIVICSVIAGVATYFAFTAAYPFGSNSSELLWILNIDLVLLLLLVAVIARRLVSLYSGRRTKTAGSALHVRLVFVFSVLAIIPTVIMVILSVFFFHFGVQSWFSERVTKAVTASHEVAKAYLAEHQKVIKADILAMAHDLDRQARILDKSDEALLKALQTHSMIRNLSEAIIFNKDRKIVAETGFTFSFAFETLSKDIFDRADLGEVVIIDSNNDDRVRALVKLENFNNYYLFVGRLVDPTVLSHLDITTKASQEYSELQEKYTDFRITITLIFVMVALLLLFAAIWLGLFFARQLVVPIGKLILASENISSGNLDFRIKEAQGFEELEFLNRSFNKMTEQLSNQRNELIQANKLMDQRRRFMEAILAGASSGIIGASSDGVITLINSSAEEILGVSSENIVGDKLSNLFGDDIYELIEGASEATSLSAIKEIPYKGASGLRNLMVNVTVILSDDTDMGLVVTFDDITAFQSAQRKAAWSDVARRIAHEIKNPLTPIQLSAERLKKKYLNQISNEKEVFSQCTDTIVRAVDDIGRMVNEFSNFARMPEPVMKEKRIIADVKDVILLLKQAYPDISFRCVGFEKYNDYIINCDAGQVRQAFSNILQNSVDAVNSRTGIDKEIVIEVGVCTENKGRFFISVTDNGIGLPKGEALEKLYEPYVTHKKKGTGLGLAIVKKIMEDHNGDVLIRKRDDGELGVCVILLF